MDLYQLDCFRTVARMEHISNAAVVLHVTQPALSKIISRVEDYAGAPLFDRVKGKIKLNASGTVFLETLDEMFGMLEKAKQQVEEINTQSHNKVRLASSADSILFMLAERFFSDHPDIRVWYSVLTQKQIREGFMKNTLDFALTTYPIKEDGIEWEPLGNEEILLVCSDQSPFYGRRMVSFPELAGVEMMCETKGAMRDKIFSCCEVAGFRPNIMMESTIGSVVGFEAGLTRAVAFMPAHRFMQMEEAHEKAAAEHMVNPSKPSLSAARLQLPSCSWTTGLARPLASDMNENCECFYNMVLDYFENLSKKMDTFMHTYFEGTYL